MSTTYMYVSTTSRSLTREMPAVTLETLLKAERKTIEFPKVSKALCLDGVEASK